MVADIAGVPAAELLVEVVLQVHQLGKRREATVVAKARVEQHEEMAGVEEVEAGAAALLAAMLEEDGVNRISVDCQALIFFIGRSEISVLRRVRFRVSAARRLSIRAWTRGWRKGRR